MTTGKRERRKLPARVQRIVDRLATGERLCLCRYGKTSGESEDRFFFEPGGGAMPRKVRARRHQIGAFKAARRWPVRRRHVADVG